LKKDNPMNGPLPTVLVCSPRLCAEQMSRALAIRTGQVADPYPRRSIAAIAARILAAVPVRIARVGLSIGRYIAFF
jgi:hypothetical protein